MKAAFSSELSIASLPKNQRFNNPLIKGCKNLLFFDKKIDFQSGSNTAMTKAEAELRNHYIRWHTSKASTSEIFR